MALARSTGALLGTDESSGSTISNNATGSGSQVDLLGDDTSAGEITLYLCATSTVAVGTLDVFINFQRVTGAAYTTLSARFSVVPINGSIKYPLGTIRASRFVKGNVLNNATGASATNVSLLYELTKLS